MEEEYVAIAKETGAVKIKGAVIKAPRDWMRTAYGADAYQRALEKLTAEERAFVDGTILAGSFYPLAWWEKFHAAMREQARGQGDSDLHFNMRNMREAGSSIVRGVYKFILGLMNPTSVLEKAALIFSRTYSEGRCEVVENGPGRAILRYYDCSAELRSNLTNNFPTSLVFVLELNGVKNPNASVSRNDVVDDKLVFEVTVTYDD
jgi:hypothetical protein